MNPKQKLLYKIRDNKIYAKISKPPPRAIDTKWLIDWNYLNENNRLKKR